MMIELLPGLANEPPGDSNNLCICKSSHSCAVYYCVILPHCFLSLVGSSICPFTNWKEKNFNPFSCVGSVLSYS